MEDRRRVGRWLLTERPYQKRIEDMLTRFGWKWWHVPAPMRWDPAKKAWVPARQAAGLCDIIATHDDPPRLIFMEVKGEKGKLSDEQREFLQAVKAVVDSLLADFLGYTPKDQRDLPIGVFAVWPEDEQRVEQMLRTRNVA